MANMKAVSNEEIITALLQNGTVNDAAAAAGITPREIYSRMQDREFKAAYEAERNSIIRQAAISANRRLEDAIETVADIMNSPDVTPETRLQAARTIINNAGMLAERLEKAEKKAGTHGSINPAAFGF